MTYDEIVERAAPGVVAAIEDATDKAMAESLSYGEGMQAVARAAVRSVLSSLHEAGVRLVPVKATDEMIMSALLHDPLGCDVEGDDMDAVYKGAWSGFLAASPYRPG